MKLLNSHSGLSSLHSFSVMMSITCTFYGMDMQHNLSRKLCCLRKKTEDDEEEEKTVLIECVSSVNGYAVWRGNAPDRQQI